MEPVFEFPIVFDDRLQAGRMRQLHEQLRAAILDQRLRQGTSLPSTRDVAASCRVARNTVIAAYDLLIAEGYALPRKGARAVVADIATRRVSKPRRLTAAHGDARMNPAWGAASLQPQPPRDLPERSFRLGIPEHRHFPHAAWRRLSAQSLRAWSKTPFSYAPSEGLPLLREAIAQHVAFARAVACRSDDVIVTSGAQQAFDLLARLLVVPRRTRVAIEDPGYMPLRSAFAAAGARLVPVPVDDEGMCVDRLPKDVRVISVTPSHQSPTGVALSSRRRLQLLEFARNHGAVIIEDDYDGEFRFGGRPLDALQTLDGDALVFYVGTFSKSLFPGLRKGFVVAPPWARAALVGVKHCADSHSDTITQSVLAAFIREGHLARHVRRMRPIYAARREALLDGLRRELGDWLEPIASEAGLHLAVRVREPQLFARILGQAQRFTPGVQSTDEYSSKPLAVPALVFGYGVIDVEAIVPALMRLRRALTR